MKDVETNDIVLAACLKMNGCPLDKITKIGTRGTFHFSDVQDGLLTQYDLGKLLVEPLGFNNTLKQLVRAIKRTD